MMTERLYYHDSYLSEFEASVTGIADGGRLIYLDRSAFYPASGGQPSDTGAINGIRLEAVEDEGDAVAHRLEAPLEADRVRCAIDWPRRFDHMQQHTGQHVLSAVLEELFRARTVSFHMSADVSTIDVAVAGLEPGQIAAAEARANQIVFENRPVAVRFEDAAEAEGLRKASGRTGELRIIEIEGLDRSACGGTHVRSTGEIGPVLLRKLDRAHGAVRIEFLCGMRAVRRARADQEALAAVARSLSCSFEEAPAVVAAMQQSLTAAEKGKRKLALELAQLRGREMYAAAAPDAAGLRRVVQRASALDDELRALAQAFAAGSKAVFVALVENPPSILLAAAADSGVHAGNVLKAALQAAGGRGGGNAQMAQGSVPSREALAQVEAAIGG